MKFRAFALIALVILGGTSARADNEISLVEYSTAHNYNCWHVYANSTTTLELGLFSPVNPSFGTMGERAVTNVYGFECKLIPNEGVIILGVTFPVAAVDIGQYGGMNVIFMEPVPVAEYGKTVLATVDVFFGGETSFPLPEEATVPCYLENNTWIEVTHTIPATIPGFVSYLDADDPIDPEVAGTCAEGPDFRFNLLQDPAVSTETDTWGSLKSLYR